MTKSRSMAITRDLKLSAKEQRLQDAVDILLGKDKEAKTDVKGRTLASASSKWSPELHIKVIATRYLAHIRLLEGAPRVAKVKKRLMALHMLANKLAECIWDLDPWSIEVFHESLGPAGVIWVAKEGDGFPNPADDDPKESVVVAWNKRILELAEHVKSAADGLVDKGGGSSTSTIATPMMGQGISRLVQDCAFLLEDYGHRVSVKERGNLERFSTAVFRFAVGNVKTKLRDEIKYFPPKLTELKQNKAARINELARFHKISLEELVAIDAKGLVANIPPPPSTEETEKLLGISFRGARLQMGFQEPRKRVKKKAPASKK